MRLVYHWLNDLVAVSETPEQLATDLGLRGFEVASVEHGYQPVIDVEITANRPDCLNHLGLAREVSAMYGRPLKTAEGRGVSAVVAAGRPDAQQSRAAAAQPPVSVTIEDAELCPRYCAQVFDVTIASSPGWLADRLTAAGVRPINNIVDVTNYVMLEMGQPMHAFDLDRLAGGALVIRRARAGETLRTLDSVDRTLEPDMLVIADAERAAAIGGVMGGAGSEVGPSTTRIVLESACFQPATVRRTSKRLNLKTEASSRFERGADVEAPPAGVARAAALFAELGAGRPVGALIDRYPAPRGPRQLHLRASRIARVLGQEVPAHDVPRYLTALGFGVTTAGPQVLGSEGPMDQVWSVTVPTSRVDVTREIDLIEEVGRHHGFDRLPVTFPVLAAAQPAPNARMEHERRIRWIMTASGLSESMTFAFIEREAALPFCAPGIEPTAIANPLSEKFAVLRPSLLPGLLDSCSHNRRRGRKDVRLFETGSRFTADGERRAASFAWSGTGSQTHWSAGARPVDFFDVKGVVEHLCSIFGEVSPEFSPSDDACMVRGRAAHVSIGGVTVGMLGQLLPAVAEARGFPAAEELYVAELDVDTLESTALSDALRAESIPKYPSIVRDLSILVGESLPAAAVRGTIRSSAPPTLETVSEFDRYQGKGVPDGRVSLSLRLTFRSSDRTLTDDEVETAMTAIVAALEQIHGAERR